MQIEDDNINTSPSAFIQNNAGKILINADVTMRESIEITPKDLAPLD